MRIAVDTNVLIDGLDFDSFEQVYIPIICIEELDKLKIDRNFHLAHKARMAIRNILKADNKNFVLSSSYSLPKNFLVSSNDNEILKYAKDLYSSGKVDFFYTKDLNFQIKAEALGIPVYTGIDKESPYDLYKGYKEIVLNEEEMAKHYSSNENDYGLLLNEYLIVKNVDLDVVDIQKWNGNGYTKVHSKNIGGKKRGEVERIEQVKPFDAYQVCAIDSINNNDITILTGKAGCGKSLISISWLINALETSSQSSHKISKVIVVFNNAPLKGSQQQGYYPGSRTEKALQSNVGGILANKLGGMFAVEQLIKQEKIELIPFSDIRGIEVGSTEALYITEGQNVDSYALKTAIQRAKEGSKIIIEGDILEQQDIKNCTFEESGMFRAMEVFKGTEYFGCVKLKTNYRSPIADIADKM